MCKMYVLTGLLTECSDLTVGLQSFKIKWSRTTDHARTTRVYDFKKSFRWKISHASLQSQFGNQVIICYDMTNMIS
jgi:hypothetical protein